MLLVQVECEEILRSLPTCGISFAAGRCDLVGPKCVSRNEKALLAFFRATFGRVSERG